MKLIPHSHWTGKMTETKLRPKPVILVCDSAAFSCPSHMLANRFKLPSLFNKSKNMCGLPENGHTPGLPGTVPGHTYYTSIPSDSEHAGLGRPGFCTQEVYHLVKQTIPTKQ